MDSSDIVGVAFGLATVLWLVITLYFSTRFPEEYGLRKAAIFCSAALTLRQAYVTNQLFGAKRSAELPIESILTAWGVTFGLLALVICGVVLPRRGTR